MASYNRTQLLGNMVTDPELRYTPQGTPVANFSMAVNRKRGDGEETTFLDIAVWGAQAETTARFKRKGDLIFLEGRLQQDRWKAPDGSPRSKVVVVAEKIQFLPNGGGARNRATGVDEAEEPF
jgi:single-strand DNA-binding protein